MTTDVVLHIVVTETCSLQKVLSCGLLPLPLSLAPGNEGEQRTAYV